MISGKMFLKSLQASFLILLAGISVIFSIQQPVLPPLEFGENFQDNALIKERPLLPCETCKVLVKSFEKAIEDTSRGTFDGGDASWEKDKLGTYADSEVRFVEIQEKLCSEVSKGKDQCHNVAEVYEDELEKWWFQKRKEGITLLKFLCIETVRVCCPDNTFGSSCESCPGGIESPCNGHGKCEGEGTRGGNGKCLCDIGYVGQLCDKCHKGYYQEPNSIAITCKKCDISCQDHCRGPGPKGCEICANGYHHVPELGCVEDFMDDTKAEEQRDVNETKADDENVDDRNIGLDSADAHGSHQSEL